MSNKDQTRVDIKLNWLRNHKWLSVIIVCAVIIIGIGALTDALTKIRDFVWGSTPAEVPTDDDPQKKTPGTEVRENPGKL